MIEYEKRLTDKEAIKELGPGTRIIRIAVGPRGVGWTATLTRAEKQMIRDTFDASLAEEQ